MGQSAPWSESLTVCDTSQLRAARDLAALRAGAYVGPERVDDIRLVVSELVTNALEHGDGGEVNSPWVFTMERSRWR